MYVQELTRTESVSIETQHKAKPTKLTALEMRTEEHHRKTAKFNVKKKKWTACPTVYSNCGRYWKKR